MQYIYTILLTNILCDGICLLLPFLVIIIEAPITLIPTHPAYLVGQRIIIEMHIITLWEPD